MHLHLVVLAKQQTDNPPAAARRPLRPLDPNLSSNSFHVHRIVVFFFSRAEFFPAAFKEIFNKLGLKNDLARVR